jgi:hypothetical protein
MEYTKTVWKDLPDTSTPITADRLNNLENGVEYLFENSASGGDEEIYSTDEVKTNKIWLDNKPIYRKSFYFTQWSGLGVDTNLDNIDNIINASVTLKNTANGHWMKLAYNPDGSYGFYIKKTGNTYKILVSNDSVYTADAICSFIEYTKTTD